ncbi:ATP-binding cassette domain-containing protein [Nicoliella spurrieriana]|uniref:ATP-binding cassette domain-containing protein n=1 Tax=Nicoliella spurrieriana TaxID=2925830 RepID=A0A976RTB9_9LACO|nr:ATP-binding cassette domain-containing protein [Nicoliella spurrieriana]UQS87309.1 ATP-binding cassette domain-containing protein [Nicoliella spurrieriana]
MLNVDGISKKFGELNAVNGISFDIDNGEVLGIVGQNGAGKSTTFKMIMNFIKPDSGTIKFNNKPIDKNTLDYVGFLPEERGLYLDMTINEQVSYFAKLHNMKKVDITSNLLYWMKKLDVKGKLKSKIKNLSKGNQQKVQLITALIHKPKLIILDEPFSGLDPVNIDILINVIGQLRNEGATIIFSSHNMKNVSLISDKILLLVNGHKKLYGYLDDIRSSFPKNKLYLEGIDINIEDLEGAKSYINDYPGKIITFDTYKHAQIALNNAKNNNNLTGYRIMYPSLDDIFKNSINEGD